MRRSGLENAGLRIAVLMNGWIKSISNQIIPVPPLIFHCAIN